MPGANIGRETGFDPPLDPTHVRFGGGIDDFYQCRRQAAVKPPGKPNRQPRRLRRELGEEDRRLLLDPQWRARKTTPPPTSLRRLSDGRLRVEFGIPYGVIKYGWLRGKPVHRKLVDIVAEGPLSQESAGNIVEPKDLTKFM